MSTAILTVRDLRIHYQTGDLPVRAVEGVSFTLHEHERFGLVGESGSGKSTAAFGILRLTKPPAHIVDGQVLLDGTDLLQLSDAEMNRIRLAQISLIPQGAMNSLNPVMRIRDQLLDGIQTHEKQSGRRELNQRIGDLLEMVGLRRAVAGMYPHELSGGMKQRVCIAMAISLRPRVIIADEPTSALDVVTQRQVMETLANVQKLLGASVILVGHDMGLMAQFVDTIGVMYAGRLVEVGPVMDVFSDPLHPYTRLLIASLPSLDQKGAFKGIPGIAPSLRRPPPGCPFHVRCPSVLEHCSARMPSLVEIRPRRWVACFLHEVDSFAHASVRKTSPTFRREAT